MVRLATFNDNVQVVHIGHLFRNSGHKEWRIFVWFNPRTEMDSIYSFAFIKSS